MSKNNSNNIHKPNSDHDQQHRTWSRRDFLHTLGIAGGVGIAMGGFSVNALASPSFHLPPGGIGDRILVLIRLKGGNDGLNTIIPLFDYGTYKAKRPTIHIKQTDILKLNDAHGIPKSMSKIMPLWNEGAMKVINSVGYDNHNLSHFTSSDIWNSANSSIENAQDKSGWLGRYMLNRQPDYLENLPEIPGAIKVSSGSNITYNNEDRIDLAVNFNTPDKLIEIAEKGFYFDTVNLPDNCYYGEQIGFLRSILNVTYKYAPVISNAFNASNNGVTYSNNELSRQLAIVARLIKGNLGTRLYMVTLEGFDTHENQNNAHPLLMEQLTSAVSEFYADLSLASKNEDVLAVTFSEFGRRLAENEGGTDHGAAAPMMLFGPALNGNGVLGDNPSLTNTDSNGNLIHTTDFRSVYATLLESWLCIDAIDVDDILGNVYTRIDNLGLQCINTGIKDVPLQQFVKHSIHAASDGSYIIDYVLTRPGPVKVDVYAITGHAIASLVNEYQSDGAHRAIFVNRGIGLSSGLYIYKIEAMGKKFTGKFVINS